ncbi:thymidine phosphorylase [Candidatus Halocynthiibacter alkanivorans]|uniref:thymidine phosphorylase n=1 Tax=Candidatus Halocynthiibacter alkanivorans TaxID=2267619 RepID=UPI000DF21063|nr:thymidine phosphorylase [Candidatus Halocynthiibacter alkanivorans]
MDARAIITRLRNKEALDSNELTWFANGLASGAVTDAQAGAFAMAALLNGMSDPDRVALTLAMRDSGDVMQWDLPGPAIDKHSTGGVGDSVSLLLAPALAAMGAYVPMVSGRGLGHTGGTLDKLDAIPGFVSEVSEPRFREIVETVGCAIVSATGAIAPADKRLYAVRDVTGTVASVDLITASILSKKLAAGLDALVLDVKVGSGAFMKTVDEARELAQSLVSTANSAGCRTAAFLTEMDQPLCPSLGNALEIVEVMKALTSGNVDSRICKLTAKLGGELLVLAGQADDAKAASDQVLSVLQDGAAAERFGRMVAALGAPADFVERWRDRLPAAPEQRDVLASSDGYVMAIDGEKLGLAVVNLGGGRLRGGDVIDPSVGISAMVELGDPLARGDLICRVHAASPEAADIAEAAVRSGVTLGTGPVDVPDLVLGSVRP